MESKRHGYGDCIGGIRDGSPRKLPRASTAIGLWDSRALYEQMSLEKGCERRLSEARESKYKIKRYLNRNSHSTGMGDPRPFGASRKQRSTEIVNQ
ncbi:hypothetical protein TNCV_1768691 [Trichonephila clavipes]|nr:hypothetical protein TNCV_1768691 [Trichonephila clavipes]